MSSAHNYYVYMVASRSRVLYCGITNDLRRRVRHHQVGTVKGFSADYACKRLVWFERFQYVDRAIAREKQLKRWRREKKTVLIERTNPFWADLSEAWWKPAGASVSDEEGNPEKSPDLDLLA